MAEGRYLLAGLALVIAGIVLLSIAEYVPSDYANHTAFWETPVLIPNTIHDIALAFGIIALVAGIMAVCLGIISSVHQWWSKDREKIKPAGS